MHSYGTGKMVMRVRVLYSACNQVGRQIRGLEELQPRVIDSSVASNATQFDSEEEEEEQACVRTL